MSVRVALERAGVGQAVASREAPFAEAAMLAGAITTQQRASYFLAQVLHESGGLRFFEELASGAEYEGRRDLGNIHPGDGVRYKGRGPIQLTGRANYRAAGRALELNLEAHPEQAAQHGIGWRIAVWYWTTHHINALADRGDFVAVTRAINGGTNGLASRRVYLARVDRTDCRPTRPGPANWLTAGELEMVREWDRRVKAGTTAAINGQHLRVRMIMQRKRIWRAAQCAGGWARAHRRERYRSLQSRTS